MPYRELDFDSYINAGRYQRSSSRRSYRNGYRHRKLLTSIGELDLEIPRDRDVVYLINYIFAGGNSPCDPDGNEIPDC